ncbi:per1-like protein PGAP5 isoform X6 [Rhipicephalus microplus]|uniref:per1-like protein PGAP5 isoform X6 n=3 Tax=Rhipicephalus microplus TaxID=6941 RepID=UPI001886D822|nr:metallophosphoesterase 1-like isoform X2 [Rhipicephalus microplus]
MHCALNESLSMVLHLRRRHAAYLKKLTFIVFVLIYCEFIIYYVVIGKCSWPHLTKRGSFVAQDEVEPLKMMLLADTHLLGPKRGHWFDKLRREWQMHRTFQTALTLHRPDVVTFLGDVFDEGQWSNHEEFRVYMKRFWDLFYVPSHVKVIVAVGNHDVGFHYRMHEYFVDRFEENFNTSAVHLTAIRGNLFVTVNSMALYGDSCNFCARARMELGKIRHKLRCSERKEKNCRKEDRLETSGRPVILMHFPLYRSSDSACLEPDAAPAAEKEQLFRENWECLSREATSMLLDSLNPRAVFTGHTHHGCLTMHRKTIPEWTLPSISWRNKRNPSFALAVFTPYDMAMSKCYIPKETTVIFLYIASVVVLVLLSLRGRRRIWCVLCRHFILCKVKVEGTWRVRSVHVC